MLRATWIRANAGIWVYEFGHRADVEAIEYGRRPGLGLCLVWEGHSTLSINEMIAERCADCPVSVQYENLTKASRPVSMC